MKRNEVDSVPSSEILFWYGMDSWLIWQLMRIVFQVVDSRQRNKSSHEDNSMELYKKQKVCSDGRHLFVQKGKAKAIQFLI